MDESCVACGHFALTTLFQYLGGGRGLVKCLQGVRGWMLELEDDEEEVEELVDKEEEDGEK